MRTVDERKKQEINGKDCRGGGKKLECHVRFQGTKSNITKKNKKTKKINKQASKRGKNTM